MTMASIRRTVSRAIERDPAEWRGCRYKHGENRIERRNRAKKTREAEKKQTVKK